MAEESKAMTSPNKNCPEPIPVFGVTIPDNCSPGSAFIVQVDSRIVRVKCPLGGRPGQIIHVRLPQNPTEVAGDIQQSQPAVYLVTIPSGVQGGEPFTVMLEGRKLLVTCPSNGKEGMQLRVVPPNHVTAAPKEAHVQLFETQVPEHVQPGQCFAVITGGVRVLVSCPVNAKPGSRVRFKVPKALIELRNGEVKIDGASKFSIDGWVRVVRVRDLQYQWVRCMEQGRVDLDKSFSVAKSGYVCRFVFESDGDPQARAGVLTMIPASQAVIQTRIVSPDSHDLVTVPDLYHTQHLAYNEKVEWFHDAYQKLSVEANEGALQVQMRREFLLKDSMTIVTTLPTEDLKKEWRFSFVGERENDDEGLATEWLQEVTERVLDPGLGLWRPSEMNKSLMEINPSSGTLCEDHLKYFRFLGRVVGKALADRKVVPIYMVQHLYKHILGWPITFSDLIQVDEEYYRNLMVLHRLHTDGEDISMFCLDFTTSRDELGVKKEVELIPGGASIDVTNDNVSEYLEACLKYRMLDSVKLQVSELLLGFFDIVPEPLLTVFHFEELESLLCGFPTIDVSEWMMITNYAGDFYDEGVQHPSCQWFWEVVEAFDHEQRALLLCFITGRNPTPGALSINVLRYGENDKLKFTLRGVNKQLHAYPRAHTSFNRLDLPAYDSKEELREKLLLAIRMNCDILWS